VPQNHLPFHIRPGADQLSQLCGAFSREAVGFYDPATRIGLNDPLPEDLPFRLGDQISLGHHRCIGGGEQRPHLQWAVGPGGNVYYTYGQGLVRIGSAAQTQPSGLVEQNIRLLGCRPVHHLLKIVYGIVVRAHVPR